MRNALKFFDKLKKVPSFVWVILIAASYLFSRFYEAQTGFPASYNLMRDLFSSYGFDIADINTKTLRIYSYTSLAIIGAAVFEIILYLIYRSMLMRRQVSGAGGLFKTVVRVTYIAANIIIGLFSLLYYLVPKMYIFGSLLFNFSVYTTVFVLDYLILSYGVINPRTLASGFMRLYTLYFILLGVFSLFSLVLSIGAEEVSRLDIIAYALKLALVISAAAVIYFTVYKKLQEREKESVIIESSDGPKPPPSDEIYKGFGF